MGQKVLFGSLLNEFLINVTWKVVLIELVYLNSFLEENVKILTKYSKG